MKPIRTEYMFEGEWREIEDIQKMLMEKFNNHLDAVLNYLNHWIPCSRVRYIMEV